MAKAGRKSARQEANRDAWRDSIQIAKCLAVLEKVDINLIENFRTMDSPEVNALRLLCDNQFRKLAKVLPDLKAVELSGHVAVSEFKLKANP